METGPGSVQQPIGAPERRTLRLVTRNDIDNIHQYLDTYTKDPSAALNVEELVIDTEGWPSQSTCFPSQRDTPSPPTPDQVATHDRLKAHVLTIGLPQETTAELIGSLAWKFNINPPTDTLPSEDRYSHRNPRGYAAACTVILLSLCTNLTHLQIYGAEYGPFIWDFLLLNNYAKLPSRYLQNLGHILIESAHPSDEREYDRAEFVEHFRYFGRLPAVREYHANACMAYQIERDVTPPGSVNFRRVAITNADIDGVVISSVIRAPRALEEFVLSTGGLAHFEGGSAVASVKTIGKSLLEQKATLRVVDLDIAQLLSAHGPPEAEDGPDEDEMAEYDEEYPDPRVDEYFLLDQADGNGKPIWAQELEDTRTYGYTIGSLHDFEKLESLSVQIAALLGPPKETLERYPRTEEAKPPFRLVDGLPRGLKVLRLYDYHRGADAFWDENVEELKEKMAEKFPLLKELVGVDEPLVVNSQYDEGAGYDDENPPPEVVRRMQRMFS